MVQLGVKLNLADCYEKLGRTASAWTEFREAASLASRTRDDREAFARSRMQALEPTLVRLVVEPPEPAPRGLEILRNGQRIPPEVYGVPTPTDPGPTKIEATARGYESWTTDIVLSPGGTTATVVVPDLKAIDGYVEEAALEGAAGDPRTARDRARKGIHIALLGELEVSVPGIGVQLSPRFGIGDGFELIASLIVMKLFGYDRYTYVGMAVSGGGRYHFRAVPLFVGLQLGWSRGFLDNLENVRSRDGFMATVSFGWAIGTAQRWEVGVETDAITWVGGDGLGGVRRLSVAVGVRF